MIVVVGGLGYYFVAEVITDVDHDLESSLNETSKSKSTAPVVMVSDTPYEDQAKGIDISHYQGALDWNELSDKITFVICKATEGRSLVDTEFTDNWSNIKNSGRIRGAYHFYISSDDPVQQANFFWQTIPSYAHDDLPLVLDIESASLRGNITNEHLQSDVLTFLQTLESLSSKTPMIYSNTDFAQQYLNSKEFAIYPLWVAEYTSNSAPRVPAAWSETGWVFWQRSDTYDLKADHGDTDFDLFNGSTEKLKDFLEYSSRVAQ